MTLELKDYWYDAYMCIGCAGCRWIDLIYVPGVEFSMRCPCAAYYSLDAWGAYGKTRIVPELLNGNLDFTPTLVDITYQCQMCGSCDTGCKLNLDLDIGMVLETLRIECVKRGVGPPEKSRKIANNIQKSHNRYGAAPEKRFEWMPDDIKLSQEADILYFTGCHGYVHKEIPQAMVKILDAAKTNFMINREEWCCGYPLYSTGQLDAFKEQVNHNLDIIRKCNAKKVLFSCAECYKTVKVDYPKVLGISTADLGFEVLHITEYVDQLLEKEILKFNTPIDMKVTYHDSCNLGRLSEPWVHWEGKRGDWGVLDPPKKYRRGADGIYEQPRNILKRIPGIEIVEMYRARDNAWCCGAGGGVKDSYKEFCDWTADERLREASLTGATAIVSSCPNCKETFASAIKRCGNNMKTYDITELILLALGR